MKYLQGEINAICVSKGKTDAVVKWAREKGARGSSVLFCRSFSNHALLRIMGLGDIEKEIILIQTQQELFSFDELARFKQEGGFAIRLGHKEDTMDGYRLITAIVNNGFGDDVAEAARAAGSIGATVLNARGTASGDDIKLLKVTLVPQKDVVFLVTPADNAQNIIDAILKIKGLDAEGSGVVFQSDVKEFIKLGSKD